MDLTRDAVLNRLVQALDEFCEWPLFARAGELPPPFERADPIDGLRLLESQRFLDYQLELQNRQSSALTDLVLKAVGPERFREVRQADSGLPAELESRRDRFIREAWRRHRSDEDGEEASVGCVRHTLIFLSKARAFALPLRPDDSFEQFGAVCRAGFVPTIVANAKKKIYPGRGRLEVDVKSWLAF